MTVSLGATLAEDFGLDVMSMLVFARILECGSIAQAAAELQLSRSAASRRLAELESRIGTRLLTRTTRRLTTTEAGDAVLQHCRRIATEIRAAGDAVGVLAGGGAKGLLRVSCPPTLGRLYLLPHLGAFLERHPGMALRLLLEELPLDDIGRRVDLAVRVMSGMPEGFVARTLSEVAWVLVAAPRYLAHHPPPEMPDDIAAHDCVAFGGIPWPTDWVFTRRGIRREVRVRGRFQANNLDAVLALAEQGLGLALLPAYALEAPLREGRLVAMLPGHAASLPGAERISVVYAPPTVAAPRLRAFLSFLQERLAGLRRPNLQARGAR
jgi:DNA-binding transcriptional LysR family regulator